MPKGGTVQLQQNSFRRSLRRKKPEDYSWKRNDFQVKFISVDIGRGVFSNRNFVEGDYLLNYEGVLLHDDPDLEDETYVFEFKSKGKTFWLDATLEDGTYGRLLNDEKKHPNCAPRVIDMNGTPAIGFFAVKRILEGDELRYSYGGSSAFYPWRSDLQKLKHKDSSSKPSEATATGEVAKSENRTSATHRKKQLLQDKAWLLTQRHTLPHERDTLVSPKDTDMFPIEFPPQKGISPHEKETHLSVRNTDNVQLERQEIAISTAKSANSTSDDRSNPPLKTNTLHSRDDFIPTVSDERKNDISPQNSDDMSPTEWPVQVVTSAPGKETHLPVLDTNDVQVEGQGADVCTQVSKKTRSVDDRLKKANIQTVEDNSDFEAFEDHEDHEDSGTDYMPSEIENSDSSDSDLSITYPLYNAKTSKLLIPSIQDKVSISQPPAASCGLQSSSKGGIRVMTTNNTYGRNYDKKHFCMYCGRPQAKLLRHLIAKHSEEQDIAKYLAESDAVAKRNALIKIRNLGNHFHNTEVIRKGSGTLMVVYRQANETSWDSYVPCEFCYGYYVETDLWKHGRRCNLSPANRTTGRRMVQMGRLLLPAPVKSSSGLTELFSTMRKDAVSLCCKTDSLILELGKKLFMKHGHNKEQFSLMRNTLREIGRLLLELRNETGLMEVNLDHFITPSFFRSTINAVKKVAGFSETSGQYLHPSLALKLGHSLKKCAQIKKRDAIHEGDEGKKKNASEFLEVFAMDWTEEISTHALRTLSEKNRNKIKFLPLTEDVMHLTQHLKKLRGEAFTILETSDDPNAWSQLNQVTLAQVTLFNRRRQGETSKMKLDDLEGAHNAEIGDFVDTLSPLEQQLCQKLKRIEIVGKRGRTVPLLLTTEMQKSLDLLMAKREKVGVAKDNEFVFARHMYGSTGHIRAADVLKEASENCGAKYPNVLRTTKLRKQIATMSQILNLQNHELDILANYLGHDIRVHREYYRLPQETLQVAKISKLLLAFESGNIGQQKGRNLDEINVDVGEDIELPPNDRGSEDEDEEEDEDLGDETGNLETELQTNKNMHRKRHCSGGKPGVDVPSPKRYVTKAKLQPVKRAWSLTEKEAVLRHFRQQISLGTLPGKRQITSCKDQEPALGFRSWKNIKDFIRNKIRSRSCDKYKF